MYKSIQVGRAIAALSVAAFHLSITMGDARYGGEAVFRGLTKVGHLGVDFFFVLSGFIILYAHYNDIGRSERLVGYISKRFIRLYPIYLCYTAIFSILLLAGIGSVALPSTFSGWVSAVSLIRLSSESPPLEVAWTLFHEIAFYALFSVLIINLRAGMLVFCAWMLLCVVLYQYPGVFERTPFNTYTAAWNLNFLLGMVAYGLYKKAKFCRPAVVCGIFTVIVGVMLNYSDSIYSRMIFAFGCTFLVGGAAAIEKNRECGLYVPEFLILIGDASYTIYLMHTALQGLVLKVAIKVGLTTIFGSAFTYAFVLIVATAAGCVIYKLVEVPLLRFVRKVLLKSKPAE